MSDSKRKRYDKNSPEAKGLMDEIVHGTFIKEGMMAAFPTCFPGASIPIAADESRITALALSDNGMVYGGTNGRAAHVFVGMFHGVTGVVFDRGTVAGADRCVAVCCGKTKFAALVNGPAGGRIVGAALEGLPYDCIQEWGFSRPPIEDWGTVNGEPMVHAVAAKAEGLLVGITTRHLFSFDIENRKLEVVDEVPGTGRIAVGSRGSVFGQDGPRHLWRFDLTSRKLQRQAVELPGDAWGQAPLLWARGQGPGLFYTADANGTLYSFDETHGFSAPFGKTPLTPVGPMAVTHDGRVFGFCGSEMAKMFCYEPDSGQVKNLGVAVSVLERRRYGYAFGDAVTGRDGQIYFGEDDDLGHLWLYFPAIRRVDRAVT